MSIYSPLGRLFPVMTQPPPTPPKRILLIRPCCIGDVVMATAALVALKRAYPDAEIVWAVGGWSRQAVEGHPMLHDILDTGDGASPLDTLDGARRFIDDVRRGNFDMVVSLVRSPKMSAALALTGIPVRVGIDSAGRGFGYNYRAKVDPAAIRHEADIYRDVVAALGVDVADCRPMIPIPLQVHQMTLKRLEDVGIIGRFIVVNPSGGTNPGATMNAKRYPPELLAALIAHLVGLLHIDHVVLVGAPEDRVVAGELSLRLRPFVHVHGYMGTLTFPEIGAMAHLALLYIGNDTGLTHYAAAAGAKTAMLLGPTDPARYRADSPDAIALWNPHDGLPREGFAGGVPDGWNWHQHGIQPETAAHQIVRFVGDD